MPNTLTKASKGAWTHRRRFNVTATTDDRRYFEQGSDTIDGATTYTDLDIQYESISTVSNGGTGWFIF